METPVRTDDLAALHARFDALTAQMNLLVERQRKTEEFLDEMSPILKAAVTSAATRLDGLEKRGYFAFGRELVGVGERIVEGFSPDDVKQLGGAVVGILETVRALTQPEVLRVVADATAVLQNAEQAEPVGILGMVRATNDRDVQRGMAVMLELMRHVGRAAAIVKEKRDASPISQKRAKLDGILGSKRSRVLGVERKVAAPSPVAPAPITSATPPLAACAVPSTGPAPVATTLDGVGFGADGHLADASTWTRELGEKLAALQGITMTDAHWGLVDAARRDFEATKVSPNIRRLTQIAGVATKDIYALFPKAPGRTLAKIAGLPKPAGCL